MTHSEGQVGDDLSHGIFPSCSAPAKRILIVLHDFSGGGTERVAIRLANQWAAAGRTVRIFCGDSGGPARVLVDERVSVVEAKPAIRRGLFSRVRLGLALTDAVTEFAPDAIFGPGNFHMLVLAAMAARRRPAAMTFCKISNPLLRADRRGPAAWLRRLALRVLTAPTDVLIAMSPSLRAEAVGLVGDARVAARWEPILPAIPASATPVAREPGLIVAAGRLEPQKNFALAIQAMTHLCRYTDANLVILGEGSERARLMRLVQGLELEQRVLLPGHVRDIGRWLQRASCFLMTSRYEGYPASLVEALVCATPVVTTPCSPALDEILRYAGMARIVSPEPGAIAAALQDMLRRPQFTPGGAHLIARHDEGRAAAAYLDLMDSRLSHRAPA